VSSYEVWGLILIVVALATIVLQIRRFRTGRLSRLQLAAGMIARLGFLFLGILYATDLVAEHRRAPFIGLGIVGAGIALNLVAGVVENIRRARAPYDADEE
jgi:hypothetical protein